MSATVESPLAPGARASLVKTLPSEEIIQGYRASLDIDVSEYFRGLNRVEIYECEATHYRFYYPFNLVGKESLYRHLEQFDWNYKDDKWEYREAIKFLRPGSSVLDVGCGRGAFLKIAQQAGLIPHGIELNTSAAHVAHTAGLDVSTEMIGVHVMKCEGGYDAVCSFQVLEHVSNVNAFVSDVVRALKIGGTLILGVPNNDAFLRLEKCPVLNAPPHHMGLWTKASLAALTKLFPLKVKAIICEPLAEIDWYAAVMEQHHIRNNLVKSAYYRIGIATLFRRWISSRVNSIPGHTILAVYERTLPDGRAD